MSSMLKGGHSAARYDEDEALQKAIALSMGSSTEPCQVCDKDLGPLSPNRRQRHYDEHFSSSPEASPSKKPARQVHSAATPSPTKHRTRYDSTTSSKENVFWHCSNSEPPPSNFTPGLIPVLKKCLARSHANRKTEKAVLCHEKTVHVATQLWDLGWGCGYRNFLMACTALMEQSACPAYLPLLEGPPAPGVRHLQGWIEDAWSQGYDKEGSDQLKHQLVGTRKWIGTGELCIAFNSRSIPAQLVDFDLSRAGPQALTDWVVSYFNPPVKHSATATIEDALRGASAITMTERMPLVLQHAGHSRTIIGYEQAVGGSVNLLLFDPSRRPSTELREAALGLARPAHRSRLESMSRHMSPSRLLHKLHHRKRTPEVIDVDADEVPPKRLRSGSPARAPVNDDLICLEVPPVAIGPSRPPPGASKVEVNLNPSKVIGFFRLNPKQLGKKNKYQILYFPLTEPLTEQERLSARVVRSEKVH